MTIPKLYEIYQRYPHVFTDTRNIIKDGIFFALKGGNFNGNEFAHAALQGGAAYAITDEPTGENDDRIILVDDVLTTLQHLARHHRRQLNIPIIAITGSNGKTTTKELVTAVLKTGYKTYATAGNLNNHIGVPLTLLRVGMDAEIVVVEMGANHQKEIAGYCLIAEPTHGIITNCGKAHIEGFGGEEGVRKGKGELYDYIRLHNGTIFRNADLHYLKDMAKGYHNEVTYGADDATYTASQSERGIFLDVMPHINQNETIIHTHLVGEYNFGNVTTAIAIGLHFGIPVQKIKEAIEAYYPDNSRSQWLTAGSNQIILDAYNANPTSMEAAIRNFAKTDLKNKILWIGAMKEMGDAERAEHERIIALIQQYEWADVILVGKEFEALHGAIKWFENSTAAADYIAGNKPQNASILIKGSRGARMEIMKETLMSNNTEN